MAQTHRGRKSAAQLSVVATDAALASTRPRDSKLRRLRHSVTWYSRVNHVTFAILTFRS